MTDAAEGYGKIYTAGEWPDDWSDEPDGSDGSGESPPGGMKGPKRAELEQPGEVVSSTGTELARVEVLRTAVARTDEWLPVAHGAQPPPPAEEALRSGPAVIVADTWDFIPDEDVTNEAYHGRRRADRPARRLWLVIALVLAGLGVAAAIPFALSSGTPEEPLGAKPGAGLVGQPSGTYDEGLPLPVATTSRTAAAHSPVPTRTTASPSSSVQPAPLVGPPTPTAGAPPTATPSGTPPPFAPLNIEAEASVNTITGSAARASYFGASGNQIVGYLGKVDSRPAGTLQFNNVVVPTTRAYALTFWYVASSDRTALISVNGGPPTAIGADRRSTCCGSRTLQVTLHAGANTIMFSNPTQRCPAIDRIVIT